MLHANLLPGWSSAECYNLLNFEEGVRGRSEVKNEGEWTEPHVFFQAIETSFSK